MFGFWIKIDEPDRIQFKTNEPLNYFLPAN